MRATKYGPCSGHTLLCSVLLLGTAALQAQERELAGVTVTASASPLEERRQSVSLKTVIDRQGIEATGGLSVGEVLSKLPGVDAGVPSSDGTVALRARGMVRESVQVLIDGERPPGSARHSMLIVARMPAGELERVEIMKGASAEFGNGTPMIINLVTAKERRKEALSFKAAMGARGGEPVGQVSFSRSDSSGPWSWTLPLAVHYATTPVLRHLGREESSSGVRTQGQDDRESGRTEMTEIFLSPRLSWKDGASSFSIWPTYFQGHALRDIRMVRSQYVDPAGMAGLAPLLTRKDSEESWNRIHRLRLEGETLVRGKKLSGRVAWVNSQRDSDLIRDVSGVASTEQLRREEDEVNLGLRIDWGWREHLLAGGLEHIRLRRSEAQIYGGSYTAAQDFSTRESQTSVWLQDEWGMGKAVTVTAGVRGESVQMEADGPSGKHAMLAPSLAARWALSEDWVLRASAGAGIKTPRLDEISGAPVRSVAANTPLEPDRRGNAGLRPERSLTLDLGLEHYWPDDAAVLGANFYVRQTADFIERRAVLEGGRWVERPYNEGEAIHWGAELDGKFKTDDLGLAGGALRSHLTLPHARVDDVRLGLTRMAREVPRYILTLGHDQSLPGLSSSAGVLLLQTGRTASDVPGEYRSGSRARSVFDAYWVRKLDRTVNLRFALQNLFGADTRRTTRAYSAGRDWALGSVDTVPRAFMVSLEGKW